MAQQIHTGPSITAAARFLEAAGLPASDLTDAHMGHFFYSGSLAAPNGLVGVELYGVDALLRSLVVTEGSRKNGLGSALVAYAESCARACGASSVFLLTSTAESFFSRRGYARVARESAPLAIRKTREFAELCPAGSAFMVKRL